MSKKASRLSVLNQLNQKISANLSLDETLESVARVVVDLLGSDHCRLYLVDPSTGVAHHRASFGRRGDNGVKGEITYGVGEGVLGWTIEHGIPANIPNVLKDSRWLETSWEKPEQIRSCICYPLWVGPSVVGTISATSNQESFFNEEDIELLASLASQTVIAIQNAEVHRELKDSLEEIQRSQDMVIRAEKLSSLGVLAAGAAHEILNPASIIQIRAEMIRESAENESKEARHSEIIINSVERIRKICESLRRFSRKERALPRVFSLEFLIRETTELLGHEFRLKNIGVSLELDNDVAMIKGDLYQIQQLFVILLTNSRDAMPDGGQIVIRSKDVKIGRNVWRKVTVSDTGVGIPQAICSKIFDPFFTTKSEDQGTGLGLSVLHGIMENHKGTVHVEREVGKGTTFSIYLPTTDRGECRNENFDGMVDASNQKPQMALGLGNPPDDSRL